LATRDAAFFERLRFLRLRGVSRGSYERTEVEGLILLCHCSDMSDITPTTFIVAKGEYAVRTDKAATPVGTVVLAKGCRPM